MNDHEELTSRQRKFAEFYAESGNATEAAKKAGYSEKAARVQGRRLITNANVLKYIRQLQDELATPRIAGVLESKAILSDIARDTTQKASARVKAAETLLRAAGEFVDPRSDEYGWNDDVAVHIYMPYTERDEGQNIRREKM